jgi:hypothetical protein
MTAPITQASRTEPVALVGGLTGLGGFLALMGFGTDSLQALGTAAGISGAQAVLTRPRVWSEASAYGENSESKDPRELLDEVTATPKQGANKAEPALFVAVLVAVGGFLAQAATGTGLLEALGTSGAIAGFQGVATRDRVFAPKTVLRQRKALVIMEIAYEEKMSPDELEEALVEVRTRAVRELAPG